MALLFGVGSTVKQKVEIVSGVVESAIVSGTDIHYLVSFTNEAGEAHQRYFAEDDLTAVAETPAVTPAAATEAVTTTTTGA